MPSQAASDAAYRKTAKRLGCVFVLFTVLFVGLEALSNVLLEPWRDAMNEETEILVVKLTSGVTYLISFLLPAWLLWRLTPRGERYPLLLEPRSLRHARLMVPAGLAMIYTASVANAFLMRCLGWSASGASVPYWVDGMPAYEVVLLFLTSVLIPAFCEELLFRGVVLSVLRPYGRTVAILGSAVLFALMHQNAEKLLYTAVGGAVLAYMVLESRSIWWAILLHLLNNMLAALKAVLYETLVSGTAKVCFAAVEIAVIGGGLCCLLVLLAKHSSERDACVSEGCPPMRPVKDFLTWPMLVFLGVSVAQMALLVILEVTK